MFKRLHTPNSPLLPLSPLVRDETRLGVSPSGTFLSPSSAMFESNQKNRMRRSFTPFPLKPMTPLSISPIEAHLLSIKSKSQNGPASIEKSATPDQKLECSLVLSSAKASIKRIRSSARKEGAKGMKKNFEENFHPMRRSLFEEDTSIKVHSCSPKTPAADMKKPMVTPLRSGKPKLVITTPPLASSPPVLDGGLIWHPNHDLLDKKFTVVSILKELNMHKYIELFEREEVDLLIFCLASHDDLLSMGVDEADCAVLVNAIEKFSEIFGGAENIKSKLF